MKKIRRAMFETNSSMVHSLCIVTEDDFNKFKDGELIYDIWNGELVDASKVNIDEDEDNQYWSEEDFGGEWFEVSYDDFTTPSGDKMVAMCYYGHD